MNGIRVFSSKQLVARNLLLSSELLVDQLTSDSYSGPGLAR
jgi:hypothetical protein